MVATGQVGSPKRADAAKLLSLIRGDAAHSRAQLARLTGLSPSTVAQRVDELVAAGLVRETDGEAGGVGRRPRHLEINGDGAVVCAVDLGSHHANFGLFDLAGHRLADRTEPIDITAGPEHVLGWVAATARTLSAHHRPDWQLRGIGIGLPGPVDARTRAMVSPSRMPGWNGLRPGERLAEMTGLTVQADNDANLMALGESTVRDHDEDHFVFVKAGSSIGCGVIASGRIYRGHRGMAGDISHVTVADAPAVLCSCGRTACLDAVAGGSALVRALQAEGVSVSDAGDVVALAGDAHPQATQALREAGLRLGVILSTIMNFYNPRSLILGGILSQAEAFVAGVRSSIYSQCLPMVTDELEVTTSRARESAGVLGAARLILDELFTPQRLDGLRPTAS
ncbi:ROK family transcriptional regulator [Microbacterium luticocti]|uniref:ROK family transcriptional regulator n=1 Tax=Microbacterium luticocti TaxID=451764 RepID=UPI0004039697|nr:ROK family transcriptional regulator [Microbacterium luticocti]